MVPVPVERCPLIGEAVLSSKQLSVGDKKIMGIMQVGSVWGAINYRVGRKEAEELLRKWLIESGVNRAI